MLLERFALGFFVEIHAFCIMSNHFHILATGLEKEARWAINSSFLKIPPFHQKNSKFPEFWSVPEPPNRFCRYSEQ
jgi:REP element-mobilizing transposase RayT